MKPSRILHNSEEKKILHGSLLKYIKSTKQNYVDTEKRKKQYGLAVQMEMERNLSSEEC